MMTRTTILKIVLAGMVTAFGCMRDLGSEQSESGSSVFALTIGQETIVESIKDGRSAKEFALKNGFYDPAQCESYLKGGEKVWFSGSYGDGEAGQGSGSIVKETVGNQNRFWYVHEKTSTMQMMLPPGLDSFTGKSRWDIGAYQRFLAQLAFESVGPSGRYDTLKGEMVANLRGGTAGGTVSYGESLKLTLTKAETRTQTIVIFVKGQGPRIMEYRELGGGVGGTAKVYIGTSL